MTHVTTKMWHAQFVNDALVGHKLTRYTDGGPTDRNRVKRRAAGKRARAARKLNRR